MTVTDDLKGRVNGILQTQWARREGRVVPEPEDLTLGNEAVEFERATVLYADLSGSTAMVDNQSWTLAAEVYKSYLYCAATLISAEGGQITSYDGDRVMGIWIGGSQATSATRCALKITYAVREIINPALALQYPSAQYEVRHVVGIDSSAIRAARTGVRGGNDIVWIGRAANYAAKLTELNLAERAWITKEVFDRLADDVKFGGVGSEPMWKPYTWNQQGGHPIFGSAWQWKP